MPIIFQKPDGSLRIMQLSNRHLTGQRLPGETVAEAVARLALAEQAKNPQDLADAVPTLVTMANMPADRAKRHKWRLSGGRCVVDDTVPDPPHPKQALLDEIDAASNIAQLRTAMKKLL